MNSFVDNFCSAEWTGLVANNAVRFWNRNRQPVPVMIYKLKNEKKERSSETSRIYYLTVFSDAIWPQGLKM